MDHQLAALFEGFVGGSRWAARNEGSMHFQYCSGFGGLTIKCMTRTASKSATPFIAELNQQWLSLLNTSSQL